ncbi:putative acetyltransferase [Sanguibacter suaedae]|uniref:Histone acetyltransferase Rv0428c-like SH3 domain-containing protein n=1 Tax=Sanguibacter suaedae TaxID=2795737 RepID=A0A934I414_9MICO|nr:hypothetical protein [Sanguibacter suaedae]MBI9115189.1 hypothetical protein [Sanguibacter suaedae]
MSRPPTEPPDDRGWHRWAPGTRVMVRRRLPEGSTHLFTDLLGVVVANDDDGVTLETRAGTVRVPGTEIAVGKPVPPPPTRVSRRDR